MNKTPLHLKGIHATLVVVNRQGVLLRGASGIGKSTLAYQLVQAGHMLVADDMVLLKTVGDQLIGYCPEASQGKIHSHSQGWLNIPAAHTLTEHRIDRCIFLAEQPQHTPSEHWLLNGHCVPQQTLSPRQTEYNFVQHSQ